MTPMTPMQRRLLLALGLAALVLLALQARQEGEPVARPIAQLSPARAQANAAKVMRVIPRATDESEVGGVGEHAHWPLFSDVATLRTTALPDDLPRQPALSASSAPPASPMTAATPPTLPYVLLGRWSEGGRRVVFLQEGERNLIVREGERLGSDYLVERVAATSMTLQQLSTGTRLALELGEEMERASDDE